MLRRIPIRALQSRLLTRGNATVSPNAPLHGVPPPFPPPPPPPPRSPGRIRSAFVSTTVLLGAGAFLYYASDSRAGVHRWIGIPLVHFLTKDDPEKAHTLAVSVLASGLAPIDKGVDDELLAVEVWGKTLSNPIGIAAGFDKHAEAIDGLYRLGFSYVEIGSVTPEPQDGNPKPRVFRVAENNTLINRYGFNSEGHLAILTRLRNRISSFVSLHAASLPSSMFPVPPVNALPDYNVVSDLLSSPQGSDAKVIDALGLTRSLREGTLLGVNLGKNKTSDPDSVDDFTLGVQRLGPLADTLVINVSSPNTPGLRSLQRKGMFAELLDAVVSARDALPGSVKPPILVKIAPDLSTAELEDIGHAALSAKVDGIIVSNTTISRPPKTPTDSPFLSETGGLSGPPVKPLALAALKKIHAITEGSIPLIGCGGVSTGKDVLEYGRAGATLVQTYTAMVYEGFGLPRRLKDEVVEQLRKEGKTWKEIIGSEASKPAPRPKDIPAAPRGLTSSSPSSSSSPSNKVQETKKAPMTLLQEAKHDLAYLVEQITLVESDPSYSITASSSTLLSPLALPSSAPSSSTRPAASASTEGRTIPSSLEIPANAVLDHDAILTLLDPARAQVENARGTEMEQKETERVKKEEKKWV